MLVSLAASAIALRPASTSGPAMRDFEAYYAAGKTYARGADPYGRAIWEDERTIPAVDPSRDELLPFVGPAAGLGLWRAFSQLSYGVAVAIWGLILGLSAALIVFGMLALVHVKPAIPPILGATGLAAAFGPLTSDIALGQVAILSVAGIVAALVGLRTRHALLAPAGALLAALQPNLALALIPRATSRRAIVAFGFAFAIFLALTLVVAGGLPGIRRYASLLSEHRSAEALLAIQQTPVSVIFGFGASPGTAHVLALGIAVLAVAAAAFVALRSSDDVTRVGAACCAIPFAVPFFHEHDYVLLLIPVLACAVRARGTALALAAFATVAIGVDWLGLSQRPTGAIQAVALALAVACGVVLLAGARRTAAYAAFLVPVLVAVLGPLAAAHPAPTWPDALPPGFRVDPRASAGAVWAMEQAFSGLARPDLTWAFLRACGLTACALLLVALALSAPARRPATDPSQTPADSKTPSPVPAGTP